MIHKNVINEVIINEWLLLLHKLIALGLGLGGGGNITQFYPFANELPITTHVAPCPFYRLRRQQF